LSAQRPGDIAVALAFFDDYGPENGATRLVPGSHRPVSDALPFDFHDESRSVQLCGRAGDILVFDVDLVHAGSLNLTGKRRRSILISYFSEALYASHLETVGLRNIRMDTRDRFEPGFKSADPRPSHSTAPDIAPATLDSPCPATPMSPRCSQD